ncbi:hypothetical protein [Arthrobacter sp. 2MCAF14]|uniref:hypothetical protein n=1 Tax=Arthrobacter sp. 2MCAF14 TaxID=3232982 RepID=UPI003F90BC95
MRRTTQLLGASLVLASGLALTACDSTPKIAGNWKADDGTPVKVIAQDSRCQGMFYNGTKPLDIGGGMTCSFSTKKDANGRYSLVVSQPPNQASYTVDFTGSDTVAVYSGTSKIYTMTRQ